jgi:hypothetical protein
VRKAGDGWGAGALFYQKCPYCGQKKALYRSWGDGHYFYCTNRKCTQFREGFQDSNLLRIYTKRQYEKLTNLEMK